MAVAVTIDVPGGTEQQYQQITAQIFPAASCPRAGWYTWPAQPRTGGG